MVSPNDIVLINHYAIDRQKWDDCIDRSPNGSICIYSWFLDILCPQWSALVMGDYALVMPLPIRSKFGLHALLQPLFIQQLGIFGTIAIQPESIQLFVNHIPSNIRLVDYHFNYLNPLPKSRYIEQLPNLTLSLNKPYTVLYGSYSLNLKRKLKNANKVGLSLSKNGNSRQVVNLFKHFNKKAVETISEKWYAHLNRVIESCIARGLAEVWIVKDVNDALLAGIVLLQSAKQKRIILNLFAQSEAGRDVNAGAWLIDQFIRERADESLVFDFEGSKHKGVAQFYQSFGAISETYYRYHKECFPLSLLKMIQFNR